MAEQIQDRDGETCFVDRDGETVFVDRDGDLLDCHFGEGGQLKLYRYLQLFFWE